MPGAAPSSSISSATIWPRCLQASGQSEHSVSFCFCSDLARGGAADFQRQRAGLLQHPKVPPWPEQRSTTSTLRVGDQLSISADFAPIFCARAWQAICAVTPPAIGASAPAQGPRFWRYRPRIRRCRALRAARRFHLFVLRQDQRPLELHHQAATGGERDDVIARVDIGSQFGADLFGAARQLRRCRHAPIAACRSRPDRRHSSPHPGAPARLVRRCRC